MSQDKVNQIVSKTCNKSIRMSPLSLKGKSGWDSRLASFTGSLDLPDGYQALNASVPDQPRLGRQMHVAQCPSCHKQSPSQRYKIQCYDLDLKIKCCECLKRTCLKAWKCNCGVLWHTCRVHSCTENVEPYYKSQASSKSSMEKLTLEKTSSKRLHSNASFEQILDDDLRIDAKRAKKSHEQDETLARVQITVSSRPRELRAAMLSPNLRQRFAHLLG